jgi:hypothetical protein
VVLCYLVAKQGWTLKAAWEHLKACRGVVSPHKSYWAQIRDLEKEIHGSISLTEEDVGPTLQDLMKGKANEI